MNFRKPLVFAGIGLVLIVIGLNLNQSSNASAILLSEIGASLTREIEEVDQEAAQLLNGNTDVWETSGQSFFLMDSTSVLRWNQNDFLPDVRTVQDDFTIRLLRWPRGVFLLKKWQIDEANFLLAVIPFQNRYKINNRYLVSGWNKKIFPIQDVSINDSSGAGFPFIWNGKTIFRLALTNAAGVNAEVSRAELGLAIAGIVILLFGIYSLVKILHDSGRYEWTIMILVSFFIGGRILMLTFFPSPDIPLFDPAYFASSLYNRSIGDLFLNTIAIVVPIVYLFYNFFHFPFLKKILCLKQWKLKAASISMLIFCFFSILFPYLFIETISHNSSISLDLTQSLGFDHLRIFLLITIIFGCIAGFMLTHVFIRLAMGLIKKRESYFIFLVSAGIIFTSFSLLVQRDYWITLLVAIVYLGLLWVLRLSRFLRRTSYTTFLYLFVAIIAFSIQGAFAVRKFAIEEKIDSQLRFANAFLTDRDYLGEYLLNESIQRIQLDPFIQTRLGSPFLSKAVVRQKVKQVYLNAYFDKYDIQIHLFNTNGATFDNSTTMGFSEMITSFQQEANKTNYEGIYFLKNYTPESTKRYVVVIPVTRFAMITGYVVLDLSLKRVIPKNVFPELLLDDRFIQYFKNRDFSYAFYNGDDEVLSSFGNFNYDKDFSQLQFSTETLFSNGVTDSNYIHIGIRDEQGNVTIVSSPSYPWFNVITNFSFLFTVGLFIILAGLLSYGFLTLYQRRELNYSARIQLYVYLAFILPLVMVSMTTIGLISRSAENQLKEEYMEKSSVIGERLTPLIDAFYRSAAPSSSDLENQLIELTKLANVDASVFMPSGKLLTSSQPLIYEDRILSSLLSRKAYEAIVLEHEQSFVNNEQIGSLTYNNSYYALRSPESGALTGVLSIPFFESAYSLEKTQINVVANILTIFSIVFILFSLLSFFAVRWLTFPLQFITKTLRRTSLTESNKPLVWRANDEIGLMVNEYNKMVENLEQSKIELSRIQKESAWREIAKQVAHEVKNPLTPMKLTLQQMEMGILKGDLSMDKTKKSVHTLLEQVEILNGIASSFSAFARMPAPILQRIELAALVKRIVDLHSDYKEGTVKIMELDTPVFIMGDEQLLSRVFSNIILNALQSRDDESSVEVLVSLVQRDGFCHLSFEDNGMGIDPLLGDKIFLPHFSTKKSGSGLGLAIARQGVEQNGGTIHFETQIDKGTIFHIQIPTI